MKTLLVFLMLLISCPIHAAEPWDNWDKGLYLASIAATAADMYSTDRLIKRGGYERNCILPDHPHTSRLVAHWFMCSIGKLVIAHYLPGKIRKAFLFGCMTVDLGYARRNYIKVRCKF